MTINHGSISLFICFNRCEVSYRVFIHFKSMLTENIFKTFFILVTNSVIAVPPDPVTQLRHEVDLALEKRVIQRRGTVRLNTCT